MATRKQLPPEPVTDAQPVTVDPIAAVEAVRQRALVLQRETPGLAICSDVVTYAERKRPTVLLAIARPTYSLVVAIDASQYDAPSVAAMAGFVLQPRKRARLEP